jgi:hypothetical protein
VSPGGQPGRPRAAWSAAPLGWPPQLVELGGYTGAGRLVALWPTAFGDELMFSDGTITVPGSYRGWLCFCAHPFGGLLLDPYELGSSEQEAEQWLVDRHIGTLDVGSGARRPGGARDAAIRA